MTAPRHLALHGVPNQAPAYLAEEHAKYRERVARSSVDPETRAAYHEWTLFATSEPECDRVELNAAFPSLAWWIGLLRMHAGQLAGRVRAMYDRELALDEMLRVGACQLILDYDRASGKYRCHVHIPNGEVGGEEIAFRDTRLLAVLDAAIKHTGAKGLDKYMRSGEVESDDGSTDPIPGGDL